MCMLSVLKLTFKTCTLIAVQVGPIFLWSCSSVRIVIIAAQPYNNFNHTHSTILIYYNTASRGLTDICARFPRACSARGRVRIYQSNPEQSCVITFMLHFA